MPEEPRDQGVAYGDEALQAALNNGPVSVPDVMQTEKYRSQPLVVQARNNEMPLPIPLAVYLDGVSPTSVLAGRSDSLLGVWVVNLVTWKRHLLSVTRGLDMCRCGCKWWCTLYPIFCALAFQSHQCYCGPRIHNNPVVGQRRLSRAVKNLWLPQLGVMDRTVILGQGNV